MEIIVLGAGAIGSLYGAKLAATNDVTLIGNEKHVAAINADGLQIEGIEPRTVRMRASGAVERIGPNALILLTTKVTDSTAALAPIASFVRDDTTILCLQNGLGSEEIARAALGKRGVVLRGITQLGAIFHQPGLIRYMAAGHTVIEQHSRSGPIANAFTGAGLQCGVSSNIAADVWHKTVFNCVVNPITAILSCEVRGIADPPLAPLKQLIIRECVAVAATQDVIFNTDFMKEIDDTFASSHNIASMQQDLLRGRPTEIDYMNGAVVALGATCGVACPVNRALTTIIKAMEATSRSLLPEKMLQT